MLSFATGQGSREESGSHDPNSIKRDSSPVLEDFAQHVNDHQCLRVDTSCSIEALLHTIYIISPSNSKPYIVHHGGQLQRRLRAIIANGGSRLTCDGEPSGFDVPGAGSAATP